MSDLVVIENQVAFTNSLAIADGTGNQHKNVLAMIRKHKDYLDKFSPLAFKTLMGKPLPQGGFARPTEVALLTEEQATFLMTLLRNSPKVVKFKFDLVQAFFKARDLLMTGQMGLMQKHAILSLALQDEKDLASECGKGLADWKRKRDSLQSAILAVERQMQPELTNFETAYEAVF
ncbi:Rha family transcriptional regulator [Psychrobacter pygoscelis]|uniref:Rha family transcriptional regulator n=1 Tax=Psychrobacter pygoscelis TaxID=2488563 RepID=UPI00103E190C|nr:Rha family transcriptional regulator [Psychrobacter pygoscelis]